jgi:putative membrane protein
LICIVAVEMKEAPMIRSSILVLAACGCLASATACEHNNPPPQTTTSSMGVENVGVGVGNMQTTSTPTTIGALRAIHENQVDRSSLAMTRATDQRVKDFATKVAAAHQDMLKRDQEIASRMGIAPQESDVSRRLRSDAMKTRDQLSKLSGSDFDKAYIDSEIQYYRGAIDTIDKDLLPTISDPKVKDDVMEARTRNNEYLKEAQDIRAHLQGM